LEDIRKILQKYNLAWLKKSTLFLEGIFNFE
jgi:hypothetical protein